NEELPLRSLEITVAEMYGGPASLERGGEIDGRLLRRLVIEIDRKGICLRHLRAELIAQRAQIDGVEIERTELIEEAILLVAAVFDRLDEGRRQRAQPRSEHVGEAFHRIGV